MKIDSIIQTGLPVLKPDTTKFMALDIMLLHDVKHLPVVEGESFLGTIASHDIVKYIMDDLNHVTNRFEEPISELVQHSPETLTINDHIYDAIGKFAITDSDILPVLDKKNRYLGLVTEFHTLDLAGDLLSTKDRGSLLEVEFSNMHFSLSELVRIIEENNARILSLMVIPIPKEAEKFVIAIKLNIEDSTRIKHLLSRNGYRVKIVGSEEDWRMEELKDRVDELIKFIES